MSIARRSFKLALCFALTLPLSGVSLADARATESQTEIVLDNGELRIVLNKLSGQIQSVWANLNGQMCQLSDPKARNALYLDWNGGPAVVREDLKDKQPRAGYGGPGPVATAVVSSGPGFAEVAIRSAMSVWSPFAVEYHYRLPREGKLFYAWVRYQHGRGMPAGNIGQTRLVFRGVTGTSLFTNHVVDAKRHGPFPTSPVVETVQDATTLHEDGTVHTKYDNSAFTSDFVAHGLWGKGVGMWVLWPSVEFCNGGPLRQDLTVHGDNVLLSMFQSGHFGAGAIRFDEDEEWSKLCGPVAFYVNTFDDVEAAFADATAQAKREQAKWPYTWLKHPDYPLQRGQLRGRVIMPDGYSVAGAWAVLSPVEAQDWALSARGYQYFTRLDSEGSFQLDHVRPGRYRLNLSGADQPTDLEQIVEVATGETDLGEVKWQPVRHGETLWQVGRFDRGTTEFMAGDDPRNYERFLDYFKAFPNDVSYTIGKSDPKRDWFYAQWNWYNTSPRWAIEFDVKRPRKGQATLTVGIAAREYASGKPAADVADRAAHSGSLLVRLNGEVIAEFTGAKTGAAGYRSASQDSQYVMEVVKFDAGKLKPGQNQITFEHAVSRPFPTDPAERKALRRPRGSVMYDAIRLECE